MQKQIKYDKHKLFKFTMAFRIDGSVTAPPKESGKGRD